MDGKFTFKGGEADVRIIGKTNVVWYITYKIVDTEYKVQANVRKVKGDSHWRYDTKKSGDNFKDSWHRNRFHNMMCDQIGPAFHEWYANHLVEKILLQ